MHLNDQCRRVLGGVVGTVLVSLSGVAQHPQPAAEVRTESQVVAKTFASEQFFAGVFTVAEHEATQPNASSEVRLSALGMPPGIDYELQVIDVLSGNTRERRQITLHSGGVAEFLLPPLNNPLLAIIRPNRIGAPRKDSEPSQPPSPPLCFERVVLTNEYFSDGVDVGDLDRDGHLDIVSGPYWYAGPEFHKRYPFFPPQRLIPERSPSNSMFSFIHDFDGDGWQDILVLGRVHKHAAYWYKNPGAQPIRTDGMWQRNYVFERVRGESPTLVDIDADGSPELLTHWNGSWGWLRPDRDAPRAPWRFTPFSPPTNPPQFYHGEGIGDVNADGRLDVVINDGWFEHPADRDEQWPFHEHLFSTTRGGAQIFVDDLDGDGDRDLITAMDAHGFGVSWFEQQEAERKRTFVEHPIMQNGELSGADRVTFSQPHALAYADIDGDGATDLITGKRVWAHGPSGDVEPNAAPVVYWFRRVTDSAGTRFIPYLVDDRSGVGTQIAATDVTGDGRTDIVTASKLGTFLFVNRELDNSPAPQESN